jgi:capsular polysaccharide biosynthesis protein
VDFWDLTKLVFRRWYIAVPLLILTGVATVWAGFVVKPDYKATSYVQLIPPAGATGSTVAPEMRNPWIGLGLGALNTAATYATIDQTFLTQLKAEGLSDNVVITDGYPAPIATIEVVGVSQQQATATMDQVIERFDESVRSLQDDYGVQQQGLIVTRRLDEGKNLAQSGGKVKRAIIAIGGAGVLLTVGLTIGFDAAIRRRARRKAAGTQAEEATESALPTAPAAGSVRLGRAGPMPANGALEYVADRPPRRTGTKKEADPNGAATDVTIVLPRIYDDQPAGDGGGKQR